MHTLFLGLGSNIGDRLDHIQEAVRALSTQMEIGARASVYESRAVGVTEQANFFNTAIMCKTDMSPMDVLAFVKKVEKERGREESFHWGPREIDIDILFYDNLFVQEEALHIPHPHLAERDFVLVPLAEIAPDSMHPTLKKSVATLLSEIPEEKKSVLARVTAAW